MFSKEFILKNKKRIFIVSLIAAVLLAFSFHKHFLYGYFEKVGSLNEARTGHKSFLMADGKVLIIGGKRYNKAFSGEDSIDVNSIEYFNPKTNQFSILWKADELEDIDVKSAQQLSDTKILFSVKNKDFDHAIYDYDKNLFIPLDMSSIPWKKFRILALNDELFYIPKPGNSDTLGLYNTKTEQFKIIDKNPLFKKARFIVNKNAKNKKQLFLNHYDSHTKQWNIYKYDLRTKTISKLEKPIKDEFYYKCSNYYPYSDIKTDSFCIVSRSNTYSMYSFTTQKLTTIGIPFDKRYRSDITKLQNGNFLFSNCLEYDDFMEIYQHYLNKAAIYDQKLNKFIDLGRQKGRLGTSIIQLQDGRVLISGGYKIQKKFLSNKYYYKYSKSDAEVLVLNRK